MSRKGKLTNEERIQAVQEYMEGKGSYAVIAEKHGIKSTALRIMVQRAKHDGIETIVTDLQIKIKPPKAQFTNN